MKHVNYSDVDLELTNEEVIKDLKVRGLISKKDDAKNFAMSLFEIKPVGYCPLHQHNWEHEVFIFQGESVAHNKKNEKNFKEGDVFFVKPMEWHQFKNTEKKILKFTCLIPFK